MQLQQLRLQHRLWLQRMVATTTLITTCITQEQQQLLQWVVHLVMQRLNNSRS